MKWVHCVSSLMLAAPLAVACAAADPDADESGEFGTAVIAIAQAPADVGCIEITAVGSRVVEDSFDVTPGQSTILEMSGLPVGLVTFTGEAFSGACSSVPMGTVPGWIADPVSAQLNATTPAYVTLAMKRNARASVTVDFEAECSAVGSSCTADADCCTGLACVLSGGTGTCEDPNPPTCYPEGNTCVASADCCNGVCQSGICNASNPPCTATGSTCTMDSQCCTGACVNGVCSDAPVCLPTGAACNATTPCCSGSSCVNGVCSNAPVCMPTGAACSATTSCCTGQCFNGQCTDQCAAQLQECTTVPCCPGMQCVSFIGLQLCQ